MQEYLTDHKSKANDPLWESIGTALRVPADIVSILVNDLSRGAHFPYDIASPKTNGHMRYFQKRMREVLLQTGRVAAYIKRSQNTSLVVLMTFYPSNKKQPLASVHVRIKDGDPTVEFFQWFC